MRIVCYNVDLGVQTQSGTELEQITFFGTEDEVYKDLEEAQKGLNQALIVHATDTLQVEITRAKLQIIRHLMTHDLDKISRYPVFGTANVKMKGAEHPVIFAISFKVSTRGEKDSAKATDITKPTNILLPPGVSV